MCLILVALTLKPSPRAGYLEHTSTDDSEHYRITLNEENDRF